ncbi:hypothetical protein JS531_05025 [Bifidobacterium sp. CP2]|uniref:hypothetical protein n=1 Tax=Bifidobacterium sp. CP2 TaxID=2809025 RepID=UPI001BDC5349|nr:hypothetical protein [Bifidobacterium sp. CP2]MBT1181343.1 hypothetical protein [Bifidobacterium sp. CP2]
MNDASASRPAPRIAADATAMQPLVPPILREGDLPGPLSLIRLSSLGTVHPLDGRSGYWSDHADTLYGRAMIVLKVIPFATSACALTALWVWMGGAFPDTLDVLSHSHFRTRPHGRRIRAFTRKVTDRHLTHIGALRLTTPARTACDVASMFHDRPDAHVLAAHVADCMDAYDFSPDDCTAMLDENPCMSTTRRARAFFTMVGRAYGRRPDGRVGHPPARDDAEPSP